MKNTLATITLAAVVVAGCGTSDSIDSANTSITADSTETTTTQQGDRTMVTITGELAYRERIALIPGGTATITLLDTSLQDVAADVIAEITIDLADRQVPIPFELEADVSDLDRRGTYSLRATITGPGDELQWTTDTANEVDITQPESNLGMVMLVRAGAAATTPGNAAAVPLVGGWNITEIDGTPVLEDAPATLVFGDDATLGGNTGCNSFSSTYAIDGDEMTLESEVVTTLMACDPATDAQEAAIFEIIGDLVTYAIGDDGALTLTSTAGSTIIATR